VFKEGLGRGGGGGILEKVFAVIVIGGGGILEEIFEVIAIGGGGGGEFCISGISTMCTEECIAGPGDIFRDFFMVL
jgi:hypothetical protein